MLQPRTKLTIEMGEAILKSIEDEPNISLRKLALKHGVHFTTMRKYLQAMEIKTDRPTYTKRIPPEVRQAIIDDFRADPSQSYHGMGTRYHLSSASIIYVLERAGLYVPRKSCGGGTNRLTQDKIDAMRKDYAAGTSLSQLSNTYDVCITTAAKYTSDLPRDPKNAWRGATPRICKMWYRGLKEAAERQDGESIFTDKQFMASIDPKHADYCDEKGYVDRYIKTIEDTEPKVTCLRCGATVRRGIAQVSWTYDFIRFIDEYGLPDYKEGYICPICYDNRRQDNDQERTDGRPEKTVQDHHDDTRGGQLPGTILEEVHKGDDGDP